MSRWYFRDGNGMLMTANTRQLYFGVKNNLIAEGEELQPERARRRLDELSDDDASCERGALAMRQLSLLRTQMKSDLAIYGHIYGEAITEEDRDLLRLRKLDPGSRPWRAGSRIVRLTS